MEAERWKQIKTIYQKALETAPEKRQAVLLETCNGDAELLGEVESMLRFQETAEDVFEKPVFDVAMKFLAAEDDGVSPIGECIDNYQVVREIGRGGMGAVYLAERSDGLFDQRVALKIIKRGMDTDAILRRFVMERQILAGLDHPNIARLLDGGTTHDGLPYFVMEYIEGLPVDKYCQEKNLKLTERLRLFRKICAAVTAAHQHLIVHRDLKPSNILVTAAGEPKLLDFGIAKLLHSDPGGETHMTETASRFLTPEYASPEQISGERITTQSDVYSLGTLLQKLIFGDTKKTAATQEKTGSSKTFDKDLRVILETARHPDSARRYSSVEAFSEDIRRLLAGLPVLAQRDSFVYRTSKFFQRHAAAVSLSGFAVLALIFAAAFSIWQAQRASAAQARAERRFNDVRKLANNVLFEYHDAIENLPNSIQVREKMLKDSLEYLDSLTQEAADDKELLRELGKAYEKVGTIQGNNWFGNLNDTAAMTASYQKSFEIRQRLVALEPNNDEIRREFAISLENLGDIAHQTGDLRACLARYEQARDIIAELAVRDEKHLTYLARLFNQIAHVQGFPGESNLGETGAATENVRRAVEIMQRLYDAEPNNTKYIWGLSVYRRNLGNMLLHGGDARSALEQVALILPLAEKWYANEPDNNTARENLGIAYSKMSDVLAEMSKLTEAIEFQKKAIALDEPIYMSDPKNRRAREVCIWYYKLGNLYVKKRDFAAAEREHLKALKIFQQNFDEDPTSVDNQVSLADAHFSIADMYKEAGRLDEAHGFYEKCLQSYEAVAAQDASNVRVRVERARAIAGLGDIYLKKQERAAALTNYEKALPVLQELAETDSSNALVKRYLNELHTKISNARGN